MCSSFKDLLKEPNTNVWYGISGNTCIQKCSLTSKVGFISSINSRDLAKLEGVFVLDDRSVTYPAGPSAYFITPHSKRKHLVSGC